MRGRLSVVSPHVRGLPPPSLPGGSQPCASFIHILALRKPQPSLVTEKVLGAGIQFEPHLLGIEALADL